MSALRDTALALVTQGLPCDDAARLLPRVLPLRPGGKIPAIKGWPQRATIDRAQVEAWFARPYNVGIALGLAITAAGQERHLVDLDVDPRNGGALDPRWPETYTVATPGGGWQLYYWTSHALRKGLLGEGVEFLANGQQVAAPPSIRADKDGRRYEVADPRPLAELPGWIAAELRRPGGNTATHATRRDTPFTPPERVLVGARHHVACSMAGWLLNHAEDADVALGVYLDYCREAFEDFDDAAEVHVLRVWDDILRRDQRQHPERWGVRS